jgi:DNA helicase-2/ATP-dependent DNA helicase PcrA
LAYLKLIAQFNDEVSFRRICNTPTRGIGETTIQHLSEDAKKMGISLFQAAVRSPHKSLQDFVQLIFKMKTIFSENPLHLGIDSLITEIKYDEYLQQHYQKTPHLVAIKKMDIKFLTQMAARNEKKPLHEFLNQLLLQEQDHHHDQDDGEKANIDLLSLMTMHSSKGLEFERVYLHGAEEQLLPHHRVEDEGGDIEEERRLFYVGITRAKNQLIMTYAKNKTSYQKVVPRKRTRFLDQLEGLFVERDCTTLGHLSPEEAEKYKADFFENLGNLLS